jgi:hypothetical protein
MIRIVSLKGSIEYLRKIVKRFRLVLRENRSVYQFPASVSGTSLIILKQLYIISVLIVCKSYLIFADSP